MMLSLEHNETLIVTGTDDEALTSDKLERRHYYVLFLDPTCRATAKISVLDSATLPDNRLFR